MNNKPTLKIIILLQKGMFFLEPGVVAKDTKEFVAFNIAKSFYQVYPEVFNLS